MASNKWQEPTLGWLAAKPDPTSNNKVNNVIRLAEAKLAYETIKGPAAARKASSADITKWYNSFTSSKPDSRTLAYVRDAARSALISNLTEQLKQAQYKYDKAGVQKAAAALAQAQKKNPFAKASLQDIIKSQAAPWQTAITFSKQAPRPGDMYASINPNLNARTPSMASNHNAYLAYQSGRAPINSPDSNINIHSPKPGPFDWQGQSYMNDHVARYMDRQTQERAALVNPNVFNSKTKPASGLSSNLAELIIDQVKTNRKGSTNDYYTINQDFLKAIGLTANPERGSLSGLTTIKDTALYNPAYYDNPRLFRFFDAPSANIRNSGGYIYSDEANQWGGMEYADEAAAAIFKRYGLAPDKLTEKYGQFQGMSATDNPLIYQVQLSDGRTAFYTPYDFAIHGSIGKDKKTNYTPAKSLDWWLNNATPVSLGSSFKTPSSKNSLGLKTSTPTIGFLSSVNPLDMDDADFKKFIKEYKLGNTGGEITSVKNGLYAGQSSIRQSYDDGPGFFQKALGVAARFAIPFGLSALGAGPLFSKVLGSAIGGSLSGLTPDAIAKGAVTAGLGSAAADFVKGQQWFGTTNAAGQFLPYSDSAINAIGGSQLSQLTNLVTTKGAERLVESGVNRAIDTSQKPQTLNIPSASSSPSSSPSAAPAAPSATGGGTGTQSSPPPQPTFSNSVTGSQQQPSRPQVGFATSDPSLFNRSRRWGGSWGQSIPV